MTDDGTRSRSPGADHHLDPSNFPDKAARNLEFSLFYRDQLPRLVAFLMVQGARTAVAAEAAQEAMTEAYQAWDHIQTPRAWVRTTAARAWWRRNLKDLREPPSGGAPEPSPLLSPDEAAEIDVRHTFMRLLSTLPRAQREVMAWTFDGYSATEIGHLLGKEPATVRSLLRGARAALRASYQPDHELP
jgi:RNA polymerase sigma factor (sigma-70 family)